MNINMIKNNIGKEGAEACCLARGFVAPGFGRVNTMEPSGVPVAFETCESLVVLVDWCSGGSFHESFTWEHGMEARWKWNGQSIFKTRWIMINIPYK